MFLEKMQYTCISVLCAPFYHDLDDVSIVGAERFSPTMCE